MKNKSIDIYPMAFLETKDKRSDLESESLFDGSSRASYFRSLEKALKNLSVHDAAGKKKIFV